MAPEQLAGREVTVRSDVYSLAWCSTSCSPASARSWRGRRTSWRGSRRSRNRRARRATSRDGSGGRAGDPAVPRTRCHEPAVVGAGRSRRRCPEAIRLLPRWLRVRLHRPKWSRPLGPRRSEATGCPLFSAGLAGGDSGLRLPGAAPGAVFSRADREVHPCTDRERAGNSPQPWLL